MEGLIVGLIICIAGVSLIVLVKREAKGGDCDMSCGGNCKCFGKPVTDETTADADKGQGGCGSGSGGKSGCGCG